MIPIPVYGGASPSDSRPISVRVPLNMFAEVTESERAPISMMPWPGHTVFSSGSGGADRGMYNFSNVLYKVSGQTLYSIALNGTQASIGTIAGGERCYFADNFGILVIATGGVVYTYDGTTLAQETDSDLETPYTVAMLNGYWIYSNNSTTGRFTVSDFGAPGSIPTDYDATAESAGDSLLRPYAFQERVYMFGEHSIEPWYFSGDGQPPFAKESGGVINKGLGAIGSIANNDQFVFFLAEDKNVYALSGYQVEAITNLQMATEFEGYTISDAIGMMVHHSGQDFYVLRFPTQSKTWAYSSNTGQWYELSITPTSHTYCYGKNLVAYGDDVLAVDRTAYTDNGTTMIRETVLGPITSKSLGAPGQRIGIRKLRVFTETGVSLITGEGSDADVVFSISSTGGRTFEKEKQVSIGRAGRYKTDVIYNVMEKGMDFHVKIRVSDPIKFSIHDAAADLYLAGY